MDKASLYPDLCIQGQLTGFKWQYLGQDMIDLELIIKTNSDVTYIFIVKGCLALFFLQQM